MANKFSYRRRHAKKPSICISKPPPKPYQYPPYPYAGDAGELSAGAAWALRATLPPIPLPPFKPITVRNLIFHCYPNPKNDAWLRNLQQLRKRWKLFNGRRILAIATGPDLLPAHFILNELDAATEYLCVPNDPRLREAATFLPLMKLIRSLDSNEATFYAHSKGSSGHHGDNADKRLAIRFWRNRMYRELLNGWPNVRNRFRTAAAVGTFKIDYSDFPDHVMRSPTGLDWGQWHFAGNFFWFRHDLIFRDPHWSELADDPYAVEMWLGALIDSELAQSVYQPWCAFDHPPPDLYNPNTHINPIF